MASPNSLISRQQTNQKLFCRTDRGRNITVVPNSLDFSDLLKFGTLGAEFVCRIGPNSGEDFADIMKSGQCVAGALGAALVKLVPLS